MRIALFILSFMVSAFTFSQNEDLEGIVSCMNTAMRYSRMRPQEKVFLHFDNTGYFKGETIWFKAYVVRTDDGSPTDLSHILYVELLNPSGDVVEKRTLPIDDGMARGDIKVDSIMTTGFYEVRAYTRYMTNWGTDACFSRVFPIFNSPKTEGDYSNPEIDKISYRQRLNNERKERFAEGDGNIVSVQEGAGQSADNAKDDRVRFFPEGGDRVRGLPSRVAFVALDKDGMPMSNESCQLTDGTGASVGSCSTDANGHGVFTLSGDETDVVLTVGDRQKRCKLPDAKAEGCSMIMDVLGDEKIRADVYASEGMRGRLLGFVMMRGGVMLRRDTITATDHFTLEFERQSIPAGVNQLTVFDSEGRIQAERLFFVCPRTDGTEHIDITSATPTLKPCGKVTFNLTACPDANLSFTAVDAAGMVNGAEGNMKTWMLLSSELKGYIAHPEYYFEADDEEHRRAADLLMMVQGWRRYDWTLMTGQSTMLKNQPIEDKQYLFGRLRQKSRKNTVDNVWLDTKLYNRRGEVVEGDTKTDSLGNYVFILPEIEGEWNLSINTGKEDKKGFWKDVDYFVAIDRVFSPEGKYISPLEASPVPYDDKRNFKWKFSDGDEEWVSITKKDHVLSNVTVKAKGRVWDRTGWSNEETARRKSLIYYNCDEAADRILDEGQPLPTFGEWLKDTNSFFDGEVSPTDIYVASPDPDDPTSQNSATGMKEVMPDTSGIYWDDVPVGKIRFFADGLTYKSRPIVWIIDNQFCTVTNYRRVKHINVLENDNRTNSAIDLPIMLDEVKTVYVSEDLEAIHRHIYCTEIERSNPVVLYCYTHRSFAYKHKGIRNTHFQGYNVPSTFQMEDYSVLPPMEDHRRTLYWQPDVKTDAQGRATVEFWNNSSCSEMYVSCQGMTGGGKVLTSE